VPAYEGRLELTWTNKSLRLLAHEDGSYEWVPLSSSHNGISETRIEATQWKRSSPTPGASVVIDWLVSQCVGDAESDSLRDVSNAPSEDEPGYELHGIGDLLDGPPAGVLQWLGAERRGQRHGGVDLA
jgi:hypothetical protein